MQLPTLRFNEIYLQLFKPIYKKRVLNSHNLKIGYARKAPNLRSFYARRTAHLTAVSEQMIHQYQRHHSLADGRGANAYARIMAALCNNLNGITMNIYRLAWGGQATSRL